MSTPDERYQEAETLKNEGKTEEATQVLLGIVEEHPDHVLSHMALGVLMQKLGKAEESLFHARKVTELEPNDPFNWAQLSVVCQRNGRIQEAEDAMAKSHEVRAGG